MDIPEARSTPPRVLIVGCGAVGGVIAAHLFDQGNDVTVLSANPLVADAVNMNGLQVRGDELSAAVRGRVLRAPPQDAPPFDYVLLATQPFEVVQAARRLLPVLAPRGAMVCLQAGLCDERVVAVAGPEQTLGAVVTWSASTPEPGVYERTSAGGFVLGRLDGADDPRLGELGRLLEAVGPSSITSNLAGARWSKLALDAALWSIGLLGGARLGLLARHRFVRRLSLELITEAVRVAREVGVELPVLPGTLDLEWIALTDDERVERGTPSLQAKHALLRAVCDRSRRLCSPMLAAFERGDPPAVELLSGEVVWSGSQLGVPTPVSYAMCEQVQALAKGEATPSMALLRAFFERTRTLSLAPCCPAEPSPEVAPPLRETPVDLGGATP